jgi:hypothetical protein
MQIDDVAVTDDCESFWFCANCLHSDKDFAAWKKLKKEQAVSVTY